MKLVSKKTRILWWNDRFSPFSLLLLRIKVIFWVYKHIKNMAMTIDDIKRMIVNDENLHLELQKTTGELKEGMNTACAFLNGEGGWLIFGIAPTSLRILGQEVNDNTQRKSLWFCADWSQS